MLPLCVGYLVNFPKMPRPIAILYNYCIMLSVINIVPFCFHLLALSFLSIHECFPMVMVNKLVSIQLNSPHNHIDPVDAVYTNDEMFQ